MKRWVFPVLLSLLAAGCGGGGGAPSAPNAPARSNSSVAAKIAVKIPSASTAIRKPKIISPNTATVVLSVLDVNGVPPSPAWPTASITIATNPGCQTSGGTTTCTITYIVPVSTAVIIQVATFDAQGNELNVGTLTLDTTQANLPQQTLTLGDFPTSLTFGQPAVSFANTGSSTPVQKSVDVSVFNGTTLLTPGVTYGGNITITPTNVPAGAITVTPASLTQPDGTSGASNTISVSYTSSLGALPANASLVFAFNGQTLATLPIATLNITSTSTAYVVGSPTTVTLSEPLYSGAFTIAAPSLVTTSCNPANCTPASAGGTVTLTITPVSAGSGTVTVTDSYGTVASIPVTTTSTSGGGPIVGTPTIYKYTTSDASGKNYGITVGPDGQTLWFVDQGGGEIGQIGSPGSCTASCSIVERTLGGVALPAGQKLQFITAAQDGNLYLTDQGSGADFGNVYQQTCLITDGASCSNGTSEAMPQPSPAPAAVVNTPSGLFVATNYSDPFTNGVVNFSPVASCCTFNQNPVSGVLSSGPGPGIFGLALDSSGSELWYTDTANGFVGILNFSGFLALEQPVGQMYGGGARPRGPHLALPRRRRNIGPFPGQPFATPLNGIIEGHDGYLYVAEAGANQIDRLDAALWKTCTTTGCLYTPLAMPNGSAVPMNFVNGPDGNVWFTDTSGYVGVIVLQSCTASGCKVQEYHTGGAPWGIAAGPDGNIWFTDSASNTIGKVVLQ